MKKKQISVSRRANRTVLFRTFVLMAVFGVILFAPLGYQLYQIQIVDSDYYERSAVEQQTRNAVISPVRGSIYDRNYKPLVLNVSVDTVVISPADIKDEEQALFIARELSRILDVDYEELYAKTQKSDRYYEVVKKRIDAEPANQVRDLISENKLQRAVYVMPDSRRYYPGGNFLSHVLGFTGSDNQGVNGIEMVCDEILTGTPGRVITAKDGLNHSMPFQYEKHYEAQDGLNVVLTVDSAIQSFVEKHLKDAVVENDVRQRAAAIVMEVKTGRILAMDTQSGYDPNAPYEISDPLIREQIDSLTGQKREQAEATARLDQWRNKAVVDSYEPGSTFKIITTAIALEEKAVGLDDTFFCAGSIMVPGWNKPIHCHKRGGHGLLTFVEGVQNSCNPTFIAVAQRVGTEKFYEYFKAFGFTEKTGIDIPGESKGKSHSWKDFDNLVTLSTYAFGQTFTVTPIQLVTAVSAVANGGYLMKPHLIREYTDASNNVVQTVEPEVVREVISRETSRQVCEILETVVSVGTGKNAYVAGYRVAGKTGTSQKRSPVTGEYMPGKYVVSFVAVAPADDPQIALLVMLDEPMYGPESGRSGGAMAAPVAGRIIADLLPYLQVEPKYTEEELQTVEITAPSVSGLALSDALKRLDSQGIKYRVVGEGESVTLQSPAAGARIPGQAEIILYLDEQPSVEMTTVPDVYGLSVKRAAELLAGAGLYLNASGATAAGDAGVQAYTQDIPAGDKAAVGAVVHVEFRDMSLRD